MTGPDSGGSEPTDLSGWADRIRRSARRVRGADGDTVAVEVVRGAAAAFVVKGVGFAGSFLLSLMVARLLGAAAAGLFFLGLSLLTIAAVLARFGMDNVLVREVARADRAGRAGAIHAIGRTGLGFVLGVATLVGLALYALAGPLSVRLFDKPDLAPVLHVAAAAVPFLALAVILSELVRGLRRITFAELLQVGGPVIPVVALVAMVVSGTGSAAGAMAAYAAGTVFATLLGLVLWSAVRPRRRGGEAGEAEVSVGRLVRPGSRLFVASIMDLIVSWAGILLLGVWATKADVGIFSVALRVALLLTGVLKALNSIAAPIIARLYQAGDLEGLETLVRKATAVLTALALPAFLALALAADFVMGWFGSEFATGGSLLIVLALGQLINVSTGPVSYILMMTGHEAQQMKIVTGSAFLCVALSVILIPLYGGLGAAIATAVTLGAQNVAAAVSVGALLGIRTVPLVPVRTPRRAP